MSDIRIDDHSEEFMAAVAAAVDRALEGIGAHIEGEAKELINSRTYPHADGTKHPYVDTGTLKNSITYQVDEDGDGVVTIGTNIEYAIYIHEGTSKIEPNRFLKDAVNMNRDQIKEYIKKELESI